jgi:hypothetical protein
LRALIARERPDVLCIQESKCALVNQVFCEQIWGGVGAKFIFKGAEGLLGGIIIFWRQDVFQVNESFVGDHLVGVRGCWVAQNLETCIVNVYAPCDAILRRSLWEEILNLLEEGGEVGWCLTGEFNEVKDPSESSGRHSYDRGTEIQVFYFFIAQSELVDLPLTGWHFTCIRGMAYYEQVG